MSGVASPFSAIVDTGSTGLVVPQQTAIRTVKSCLGGGKVCKWQTDYKFNFLLCYKDGSGYFVAPDRRKLTLGSASANGVTVGIGKVVFDSGEMQTKDKLGLRSIWGVGGGGGHCAFAQKDALQDFLAANKLPYIWSLRSVLGTKQARMYLGQSAPEFRLSEKLGQYTSMTQYDGRYLVQLGGFIVKPTSRRGTPATQKLHRTVEVTIDSGSTSTVLSNADAFNAAANLLQGLACRGEWTPAKKTLKGEKIPNNDHLVRYWCAPAMHWERNTITLRFNDGASTTALPVGNFLALGKGGKLHLLIFGAKNPIEPNVLGIHIFHNNWCVCVCVCVRACGV